jgi:hypothetical protein
MRITALLVPADEETPISAIEVDTNDIDSVERIVGGVFEVVDIERPAALVLNENSVYMDLPFNKCATRLLWCHASQYRGHHFLVGPVLVTGAARRRRPARVRAGRTSESAPSHGELQARGTDRRRWRLVRQRGALHCLGRRIRRGAIHRIALEGRHARTRRARLMVEC